MKITDFEYAGQKLSAKNCMICSFDSLGLEDTALGGTLSMTTVRDNNSFEQRKIASSYDDQLEYTFQICKINCNNTNDMVFSNKETRQIMKWLNRKSYEVFKPIYDKIYDGVFYRGYFNVKAKVLGADIIGFELTFTSNAPYGFENYSTTVDLTAGGKITINTDSDEIGYIYPSLRIVCKQAGDLTLTNNRDGQKTIIKNCSANEVITISKNKVIASSSHTTLSSDFNYLYPRLITTYSSDANTFSTSLPCNITFSYETIRKVGVM